MASKAKVSPVKNSANSFKVEFTITKGELMSLQHALAEYGGNGNFSDGGNPIACDVRDYLVSALDDAKIRL